MKDIALLPIVVCVRACACDGAHIACKFLLLPLCLCECSLVVKAVYCG